MSSDYASTSAQVDDARESRRIVRMYSWDVEERLPSGSNAQVLGHVLAQERGDPRDIAEPWRRFFEPQTAQEGEHNPITEIVATESSRLREKWDVFRNNCPNEDQLDLRRSEPTIEGVIDVVQELRLSWQAKRESGRRGKVMKMFHKFCSSIHSHKTLLEILPDGNEYVSIFTGTLNLVIRASVNHERIAEGLSEALCALSEHVVECKAELEIFSTQAMLALVAEFYASVFLFLSDTMDYFMEKKRKRLLDSFNEDFYHKFESQIERIKHRSNRIRNLAAQNSRAEQRATRLIVEDIAHDVRFGLAGEARHRAEMAHYAERVEKELFEVKREAKLLREEGRPFRELADRLTQMLEGGAMGWLGDMREADSLKYGSPHAGRFIAYPSSLSPAIPPRRASPARFEWTAEEVASSSQHLEDFFDRGRSRLPGDSFQSVMVTAEVLQRLSAWMRSNVGSILWLDGPPTEADDFDNPLTMLAAKAIDLADQSKVPVISYFCHLTRGESLRPGNDTREAQTGVALVCALIRQLIEMLPPRFGTEADLSDQRMRLLNGSLTSWAEMLKLLGDILEVVNHPVLCVIDGFHWLDDRSMNTYLRDFVTLLRADNLKVLLTTTGRSACLRQELTASETLTMDAPELRAASWRLDRNQFWQPSE